MHSQKAIWLLFQKSSQQSALYINLSPLPLNIFFSSFVIASLISFLSKSWLILAAAPIEFHLDSWRNY